jgi:hypothetical protein
MKKTINILTLVMLIVAGGCKEEQRGLFATDNVAPGPVKNPVAQSLPGGAKITYELPADKDLLYIQAVYTINGIERNASATLFNNFVEIMGFGTTDEQTVKLYAFDRSGNKSEPVTVTVHPDTPPVRVIRETLSMAPGFGGIRVTWKNEYKADVVVTILVSDSIGDLQQADVIYSNLVDEKFNLRGLPDSVRTFGVYIRDRWDNFSDTMIAQFTPLFEMKLDKLKWKRHLFPGDNTTSSGWGAWPQICDDIIGNQAWETQTGQTPILFSIDLGVTAKLSRYSLWHRGGNEWEFRHYNPKRWKVYGTDNPDFANISEDYWNVTEGGWTNDWTLLADCYSFKPSGEKNPITQADRDYANRGFETEFSTAAPPMRYIRFYVSETWGGGNMVHVSEISFWGKEEEEEY